MIATYAQLEIQTKVPAGKNRARMYATSIPAVLPISSVRLGRDEVMFYNRNQENRNWEHEYRQCLLKCNPICRVVPGLQLNRTLLITIRNGAYLCTMTECSSNF